MVRFYDQVIARRYYRQSQPSTSLTSNFHPYNSIEPYTAASSSYYGNDHSDSQSSTRRFTPFVRPPDPVSQRPSYFPSQSHSSSSNSSNSSSTSSIFIPPPIRTFSTFTEEDGSNETSPRVLSPSMHSQQAYMSYNMPNTNQSNLNPSHPTRHMPVHPQSSSQGALPTNTALHVLTQQSRFGR